MTLENDLSSKPYFDDFDQDKNFHQVLYRPAVAVQARELNQMQSILQDQINKFGRHIFKDGSVVEGCSFTFDNTYDYVKIQDNYANNFAISNIDDLNEKIVRNTSGLEALVINTRSGFQAQDPDLNTLYIKYLTSGTNKTFANGEVLQVYNSANLLISNVVVATVANSTGTGYAFTTTEGVIFKKGYFIRVEPQTLIVTPYNNQPNNVSVGFDAIEDLITPEIDTTLLDNAAGTPNFEAPGAHRLKLVPTLMVRETSLANVSSFFSLCDFVNGLPISIKNDPQYAALGKDQARRTFETNGDYVVNPFLLNITEKQSNTTHLNLVVSPGTGYVKGSRIEFINNNTVSLRKGLDFESISNQNVTANFGNYFVVKQFVGDFNNDSVAQVELHSEAKFAISNNTFLNASYSANTRIGTAYVRGVAYDSGTPGDDDAEYLIYLFNIRLLPGFSINNAKSVIYHDSTLKAVADIVLTFDSASSANVARIQDPTNEIMIYPFGQKAIKSDGFSNEEFVYRNRSLANFGTNGTASVTIPTAVAGGTESIVPTGTYSTASKQTFLIIPTVNGFSSNLSGGITAYSTNTLVTGNATANFTVDYNVGDYIFANNNVRRIDSIVNNTTMFVNRAFNTNTAANVVHQKIYPAGVPVNFNISSRTISATGNTASISLGQTVNAAFTTAFYYNINRETVAPIGKSVVKNALVRILLSNNAGGSTGPWCLGLPDVLRINRVYVGAAGSYSNTNPDLVNAFILDNGQRDAHYDLAYISSNRLFSNNTSFLVDLDHFIANTSQGVGFFTAESYPIDDANTANTIAIQTYQIPTYTSKSTKRFIDLRDAVDFRPYAINTAISTTNIATPPTINPSNTLTFVVDSYLPVPDTAYEATIQYYLPRKDRISLSTSGDIIITEGTPSLTPNLPPSISGTMTIGTADISQYPSLDTATARRNNRYDYAVQVNSQQTKRYTMSDIGTIAKRVDNLEYYTSLSLIEQAATNLLVRSGVTGENRFKNGILVDPFKDHTIGNTLDTAYNIAIDSNRNELRPVFTVAKVNMRLDLAASNNIVKTGDLITLAYSNEVTTVQGFASTTESLIAGNFYGYRGNLQLSPPGDVNPDYGVNPEVINNIDLYSNWVNKNRAWNTQWGAWTDANIALGPSSPTSQGINSQNKTTLAEQTQEINKQLTTKPADSSIYVGDFVQNVSLNPFVKPGFVFFRASGLKPFSRVYPYFANSPVSNICRPIRPYTGTIIIQNGIPISTAGLPLARDTYDNVYEYNIDGSTWDSALIVDVSGNVFGVMYIPKNTFKSGELEFKLLDTPTLTITGVTTEASAIFYGSSLSVESQRVDLQIRPVVNITNEITQITNVQQTNIQNITNVTNVQNVTNVTNNVVQQAPPPPMSIFSSPTNVSGYTVGDSYTGQSDVFGAPDGFGDSFGGSDPGSKIICTAMNKAYGFGSYRQAIWLQYSAKYMTKEHEIGYHAIFLPLVDIAYNHSRWYSKPARKALEHIARHRTADLRAEMRGSKKRDPLGRAYRFVLEPICYIVGKLKASRK